MAKQTKNNKTTKEYSNSYKHGNLMMISTMLGICTLLVVMLLSTAFKSVSSIDTAFGISKIISYVFLVSFVVVSVFSFKKDKALWEYAIYSLVMAIGFMALGGTSAVFFLPKNVDFLNKLVTTRNANIGLIAANIAYLIFAFVYHVIKSEKK